MSHENVTSLAGQETDPLEAMRERTSVVYHIDGDLGQFLCDGRTIEPWGLIEDAAAIADLLAACGGQYGEEAPIEGLSDGTIPRAGWLAYRLLGAALALNKVDEAHRDARLDARMDAEAAAEAERRDSPAMKVATLAHMNALNQDLRADLLEELEKQAPEIGAIVAEYLSERAHGDPILWVDPADPEEFGAEEQATTAQAHGRHLVVLDDASENIRTWLVDDETAKALRPLAQDAA